jgi:hypothetical protein
LTANRNIETNGGIINFKDYTGGAGHRTWTIDVANSKIGFTSAGGAIDPAIGNYDSAGTFNLVSGNATALTILATGNVGIGTTSPGASAKVEIASTAQSFLPPRMTATQGSAISSPAEGLMVYVTDTNWTFTAKGWWGYDGAAWQKLNN